MREEKRTLKKNKTGLWKHDNYCIFVDIRNRIIYLDSHGKSVICMHKSEQEAGLCFQNRLNSDNPLMDNCLYFHIYNNVML